MGKIILKDNERIDDTGFGEVKVIQVEGMGYGVDAILLTAFAAGETGAKAVRPAARVIDFGSGSGIIGLVLAHKFPNLTVLGVDKRDDSVDRATRAAALSGLADRVKFECAEINGYGAAPKNSAGAAFGFGRTADGGAVCASGNTYGVERASNTASGAVCASGNTCGVERASNTSSGAVCASGNTCGVGGGLKFDAVVSNPPYFKRNAAIPSASDGKYVARHETTAVLADFIAAADRMLERGGDLYIVHRPDRLADIIYEMRSQGIEPKELQFVAPRAGEPANIVLIHGIKGAGAELKLLPELAVHTADGGYTEIINKIYER